MKANILLPRPAASSATKRLRHEFLPASFATALAFASSTAGAAQPPSSMDLEHLQDQIQTLQQEVDRLKAHAGEPDSASAPAAPALRPGTTLGNSPSPTFMAGPVKITLGGFVELMAVNRDRNESADWASNFNTAIPFPNSHNYSLSEFHFTARQSRVQALFQGPDSEQWATEAYLESDFGAAGGNANYNESGSFSPRVRHYFADLTYKPWGTNLLIGQSWSLITAFREGLTVRSENIPPTIDGQYMPGFDWLRLPQLRLTQKVNNHLSIAVSAENPAAILTNSASAGATPLNVLFNNTGAGNSFAPPNAATVSANNLTLDYLPDFVAKVALDPGFGHYEAFVTERFFRARDLTAGAQHNEKTNATGFGGSFLLPVVPKLLDFQASILAGRGVGRYGSAQLPDTTLNPTNLSLEPLRGFQAMSGLILRPATAWMFYGFAGEEQVSRRSWNVSGSGKIFQYGYGGSQFDNSGCETEGVGVCTANTSRIVSGTLGGWWKFYQGSLGNGQIGVSDTWIRREIFAGVGGDPSTNINITMVSFRYYPFQK